MFTTETQIRVHYALTDQMGVVYRMAITPNFMKLAERKRSADRIYL